MTTIWQPPNISEVCAEALIPLTQCSQTGFMFLALVTQLFGNSIDNRENQYNGRLNNGFSGYGITSSIGHPQISFGLTSISPSSIGLEHTRPYLRDPIDFDGVENSALTTSGSNMPVIRNFFGQSSNAFNFKNYFTTEKSYFDFETAGSMKVSVVKKKDVEIREEEKRNKRKSRRKRQTQEYDFIIVGAGSAGCVLANRLSEVKKWKILLLEAGPEEPDVTSVPSFAPTLAQSNIDWNYRTQPEPLTCRAQRGQTCPWISGKVLGGGSAVNYLVYMRGNKKDYDDWAALGNEGWSYEEVLPYFKKSENNRDLEARNKFYHGVNGPLTVERFYNPDRNVIMIANAFKETGLPYTDLNADNQIGTMIVQTTSNKGKRVSANTAFIRPIRKRSNLIIKTNALVTKILIKSIANIAYGVQYMKNGKTYEAYSKKEVILSAGALNSPKILMLSGIGPKDDLEALEIEVINDLKVGHNLQDHTTTNALIMQLTNKTSTLIDGRDIISKVIKYKGAHYQSGALSATGPVHVTAFIRTKYAPKNETVPDIQFHFDGRNLQEFYSDPTNYLESNILPFAYYDSINVRPILLAPKSKGYLTLNKTDPVFGQPLIYPRFFTMKSDLDTLIEGAKFIITLEKTKAFEKNGVKFVKKSIQGCSNLVWGTKDYFACLFTKYTGTIFHPSGTCKMGPYDDEDAVVDSRLNVYGVRFLRVADASIMPNIIRGNTNAPVIMIGEKAADMIKADW